MRNVICAMLAGLTFAGVADGHDLNYHSVAISLPADGEITYGVSLRADRPAQVRMYLLDLGQDAVTRKEVSSNDRPGTASCSQGSVCQFCGDSPQFCGDNSAGTVPKIRSAPR